MTARHLRVPDTLLSKHSFMNLSYAQGAALFDRVHTRHRMKWTTQKENQPDSSPSQGTRQH